jgi:hypothetical protein
MKFFLPILVTLTGMLFLAACRPGDGRRDIEAFYFPLRELKDGKVYEYRSVGNPNDPPMYWHYQTEEKDGSLYLLGTAYGPAFSPDQFAREERAGNGMLLSEFYTYEWDSTGTKRQVKASIEAGNVFPFTVSEPPGVLLSSIRWEPLSQPGSITLIRNRQFDSDTTFTFGGKTLPAIKFNVRELIDNDTEGHLELEYSAEEIYAKGAGLVYFRKDIDERWQMEYQLAAIYSMSEFEEKYNRRIGGIGALAF